MYFWEHTCIKCISSTNPYSPNMTTWCPNMNMYSNSIQPCKGVAAINILPVDLGTFERKKKECTLITRFGLHPRNGKKNPPKLCSRVKGCDPNSYKLQLHTEFLLMRVFPAWLDMKGLNKFSAATQAIMQLACCDPNCNPKYHMEIDSVIWVCHQCCF